MQRSCLFLLISTLVASFPASANESLFLQVPAIVHPSAPIPGAVRRDCAIEELVGKHALTGIGERDFSVQAVSAPEQAGDGTLVQLTILYVDAFGGGGLTGEKTMTIRADIKKGGVTLGSTVIKRWSKGGIFGSVSGTCTILERVAVRLGKDVATWLSNGSAARLAAPSAEQVPVTEK
jgi:hypothetical protein